jgi:hypothetical protein
VTRSTPAPAPSVSTTERSDDEHHVATMQSVTRAILNPMFPLVFATTAALTPTED